MTSRPSSTASSITHDLTIRYDVFLSFRGEDTRDTFTDHLYHALLRAGFIPFRDNDEINIGQELKPEIEAAIIESRASIVVLSENYANSRWCLDELCLILQQRRKCNHFILPVFYRVVPSDIRNQRGSFAISMSKGTTEDVRRWKAALGEVANLTGMVLSRPRSETDFITEVVETVQSKLNLKQLSTPTDLIGMEAQVEEINSCLKYEQYNVIAICGMGGSGKTTLAQCIYNSNKHDFESSSFVENIGENYKHGLLGLQKQLLSDVLHGKEIMISSVSEGTHKIGGILQNRRLLIVLDDIDDQDKLSTLLGTKKFPIQSKIIITTRNLDINAWLASLSWRCRVHKIKLLNNIESLELLSSYAFRSKKPMKDFKELAVQLAQYCEGNPLALKVLGSSLFVSDEDPKNINKMIGIWISRLNSLKALKGNLDCRIQGVLRKSFDSLPQDNERELFLHIACFFVGKTQSYVETLLEDELYAKSGIQTLSNRCLVTISPTRKLRMHQLLQELGRNVVYEESKDPAKRSRVWQYDSYCVLRKGHGSDTIEALSLDMQMVEQMQTVEQEMRSEVLALNTSSFANMDKLKLLQLKYVELTGSYEKFPELIWLCWYGCPLQTMPFGLLTSSLVVMDMSYGDMEIFEAPMVLNSLKIIHLTACDKLVSIRNFHRLPKLVDLNLRNCSNLMYLCKSLGDLDNLGFLDLTGCTKLWNYVNQPETMMQREQKSFSLPQSLIALDLNNCDLKFDNDVFVGFHAKSLTLQMANNPFEYLPNNIDLKMLRILNLYSCPSLKSLPCIPSTLEELHIDWCTSLERVTFQSGRFSLVEFSCEGCFKLSEVQGLFKLVPIAKAIEAGLGHMQWIKAYEDQKVDLIGHEITKGRTWHTQMLYEYGIMSTYLQGIKDQSMPTYDNTSLSGALSFYVPFHHEKYRIEGLNISCLYRSLGSNDKDIWGLWAKIRNITKGRTWVYNPMVYCKPKVDEDVVWLSYWPIGNILDIGDRVTVDVYVQRGTMSVSSCGASLVYIDSELDEEYKNSMKAEEVIGGDLSEFEVSPGCYYLCRHDLFGIENLNWLKYMFGDTVHHTDVEGWRKTHKPMQSRLWKEYYQNAYPTTIELGVSINSEIGIDKIEKALSSIDGVESVTAQKEVGKLIVIGCVDPLEVATCVREFDNTAVQILSVKNSMDLKGARLDQIAPPLEDSFTRNKQVRYLPRSKKTFKIEASQSTSQTTAMSSKKNSSPATSRMSSPPPKFKPSSSKKRMGYAVPSSEPSLFDGMGFHDAQNMLVHVLIQGQEHLQKAFDAVASQVQESMSTISD